MFGRTRRVPSRRMRRGNAEVRVDVTCADDYIDSLIIEVIISNVHRSPNVIG